MRRVWAHGNNAIALKRAVDAYDEERRRLHKKWYSSNEPAMSDENKKSIAPMIAAAIQAFLDEEECHG